MDVPSQTEMLYVASQPVPSPSGNTAFPTGAMFCVCSGGLKSIFFAKNTVERFKTHQG